VRDLGDGRLVSVLRKLRVANLIDGALDVFEGLLLVGMVGVYSEENDRIPLDRPTLHLVDAVDAFNCAFDRNGDELLDFFGDRSGKGVDTMIMSNSIWGKASFVIVKAKNPPTRRTMAVTRFVKTWRPAK